MKDEPSYLPTPGEIEAGCEEIRSRWSFSELEYRSGRRDRKPMRDDELSVIDVHVVRFKAGFQICGSGWRRSSLKAET